MNDIKIFIKKINKVTQVTFIKNCWGCKQLSTTKCIHCETKHLAFLNHESLLTRYYTGPYLMRTTSRVLH